MITLTSENIDNLRKNRDPSQLPAYSVTPNGDGSFTIGKNVIVESWESDRSIGSHTWIKFEGVKFKGKVRLLELANRDRFVFTNCQFEGETIFTEYANYTFLEGTSIFNSDCRLDLTSTWVEQIEIKNIEFDKRFLIRSRLRNQNIKLDAFNAIKKEKKGTLILEDEFGACSFSNSFIDLVLLGNMENIFRHSLAFTKSVNFINLNLAHLKINEVEIHNVLRLNKSNVEKIEISNLKGQSNTIEINENSKIDDCSIHLGSLETIRIIGTCILGRLALLNKLKTDQSVTIENCIVNRKFELIQVENKGLINLNNLIIKSEAILSFLSSDLGVTSFFNCTLLDAKFEFQNSKMFEVFLVNTQFPQKVYLDKASDKEDFSQAQLVFGQLHTACKKQGDTVGELKYQSQEIEAHYKNIKWQSNLWTKLNLLLSCASNRFGQSWSRGIFFTLCVSIAAFYSIIVFCSKEYSIGTHLYLARFLPAFFKFINPIRFFELESVFTTNGNNALSLSSWAYIIDFLGRVFIAYGIYQTVQAFRRFGRK